MALNIHAKFEIAALAVLFLASCSGPSLSDRQRDEVTDIADDVADSAISDNEKVRDLESRVEALESKLSN